MHRPSVRCHTCVWPKCLQGFDWGRSGPRNLKVRAKRGKEGAVLWQGDVLLKPRVAQPRLASDCKTWFWTIGQSCVGVFVDSCVEIRASTFSHLGVGGFRFERPAWGVFWYFSCRIVCLRAVGTHFGERKLVNLKRAVEEFIVRKEEPSVSSVEAEEFRAVRIDDARG